MVVRLGGGGGGAGTQVVCEHPRVLAHCGRGECQGHSGSINLTHSPPRQCALGVISGNRVLVSCLRGGIAPALPARLPCPSPTVPHTPPTWCTLMFMLLQVPVQVGLLPKAAVAQVTLERLLFIVDVPHVPLEVRGDAE